MDLSKPTTDIAKDLAKNHLQVSLNKAIVAKWPRFWDMVLNKYEVELIRELKNAIVEHVSLIHNYSGVSNWRGATLIKFCKIFVTLLSYLLPYAY